MPSVKLLGFILSQEGISQDPEKTRAIKDYSTPTTAKAVRAFYGLASFYRMYIPKFAEISKPLTVLYAGKKVKKNSKITWGSDQQKAFETMKERLTTFPCLAYFQDELETFVHCDASSVACGAVLAQKHGSTFGRLSRFAVGQNPSDAEDVMNAQVMTLEKIDMRVEQQSDKFCGDLINFLEGNTQNPSDRLKRLSTGFYVDDGVLYYRVKEEGWNKELLVLPQSQWPEVCAKIHDHKACMAHLGHKKCLDVLSTRFYFRNMAKFLRDRTVFQVSCSSPFEALTEYGGISGGNLLYGKKGLHPKCQVTTKRIVEAAETADARSSSTAAFGTVSGTPSSAPQPKGSHGQKQSRSGGYQQSQMAIRGPVAMPKFGNKDTEKIGMFLPTLRNGRTCQEMDAMRICSQCCHFLLEEGSGAEYWSRETPSLYNCGGPHFKTQCTQTNGGGPQARQHVNLPYPQESKQLGLEHLVDPFSKVSATECDGHQVMSEGAIQLKVDTFGRQANLLDKFFVTCPDS
ncbi:putative Retrovirus-related Pol polyprotein from transposon gypsy [Hypsibius exemplaris]|uniref:RNA-directed DNA polymerase n=1 Tax=Hypsibius exemplaris TaxID=2072580 RepID=A0A9X6N926_HYPEX|nr:putative Retrovirus-related Pol polyprotein from transposon gypsy [Hypsibius exemplaris]